MTTKPKDAIMPASNAPRRPPVRVRLKRINANYSKPYPPDGLAKEWWARLQKALGTSSSHFVNATLLQLQNAARTPYAGISETAVNAALAMIEAAAPRDEIEGALAVQMACTHSAAMVVLSSLGGAGASERRTPAFASAAARLLKAYAMQVEVLRRLRHGSKQYVRVEHVHIHEGGQAVIGNVRARDDDRGARTVARRQETSDNESAADARRALSSGRP